MFFRSIAPIWNNQYTQNALYQLKSNIPAGPTLIGGTLAPKIHLLKASMVLTPYLVDTDYLANEANFDGYSAQAITSLTDPTDIWDITMKALPNDVVFAATPPLTTPNNLYGYWVSCSFSGAGDHDVVISELFPAPFPIAHPRDFLLLQAVFPALIGAIPLGE